MLLKTNQLIECIEGLPSPEEVGLLLVAQMGERDNVIAELEAKIERLDAEVDSLGIEREVWGET